jgi:cytoskeletal protein CcmA (bactofilin family)
MSKEEFNAYLGAGTAYQGQLSFLGTVRIDGEYKGEIKSEGTLILGKEANVQGKIQVSQLILSGNIEGEIIVGKKTVMHKTARLTGNIITPILAMEEGAALQGKVQMTQGPMPGDEVQLSIEENFLTSSNVN